MWSPKKWMLPSLVLWFLKVESRCKPRSVCFPGSALWPLPSAAGRRCSWLGRWCSVHSWTTCFISLPLWMCEHLFPSIIPPSPFSSGGVTRESVGVGKGRTSWVLPSTSLFFVFCFFSFFLLLWLSPFSKCDPWLQQTSPQLIKSLLLGISPTLANVQ